MAKKAAKEAVTLPKDLLDELVRIGEQMGRTCFDVVTNKPITFERKTETESLLKQWDAATLKLRDLQKGKK